MSLLQETIVYVLVLPLLLQLVIPLAMLFVYLVSIPVRELLSLDRRSVDIESEKNSPVVHPA